MREDFVSWIAIVISVIAALAGAIVIAYVLIAASNQRRTSAKQGAIKSKGGTLDSSMSEEDLTGDEAAERERF